MNRHKFLRWLSITLCVLLSQPLTAQDLRDGFAAQVDGQILAMAIEADGRVLIGGDFTRINDVPCEALCRLNVDGTVANAFALVTVGQVVTALAVQADGRIVHANAYSAEDFGIQRQFSNGNLDPSLNVVVGSRVNALAIEPDGDILVGGEPFLEVGVESSSLLRLRPNGSIDSAFTPRFFGITGASVRAIAVRGDGGIYIGGRFDVINEDSRINLAFFTPDGTLDDTLDRAVNGPVNALAVQADGKLLIGGAFSEVINSPRSNLARLLTDTLIDPDFAPAINGEVRAIEVLADGSIGIGGRFNLIGSAQGKGLARLGRDGTPLPSPQVLAQATSAQVNVLREQADRRLLFAGRFISGGLQRDRLERVDVDGRLDESLTPPPSTNTTGVLQQPDGRLLVARRDGCSGGNRVCLVRLFSDGSVDSSFATPGFNAGIRELALLPDGDVLVAGDFTAIDGVARPNLVRLNSNGSLDTGFAMRVDLRVVDFARFADGRIAVAGVLSTPGQAERQVLWFLQNNGSDDPGSTTSQLIVQAIRGISLDSEGRILVTVSSNSPSRPHGVARFFADGRRDSGYGLSANGAIRAIHALPDGRLLIGGSFTAVNEVPAGQLARISGDGSVESAFNPQLGLPTGSPQSEIGVNSIAVRRDGRIVVGLTAGSTNEVQSSLRLLEPNGAAISTVAPSLLGVVDTLYLQDDGRILFGGRFTTRFGLTRVGLARIALPGAGGSRLEVANDTAVLRHGPAAPELVAAPRLSASLDGNLFLFDAPFVRSAEGWRLDALGLPLGVSFFLRVRTAPGQGVAGAAQGLTQHVFIQPPDLRLFQNGFEAP